MASGGCIPPMFGQRCMLCLLGVLEGPAPRAALQVVIRDILLGDAPVCNGLLCEVFGPAATRINASLLIIFVALVAIAPLLTLR